MKISFFNKSIKIYLLSPYFFKNQYFEYLVLEQIYIHKILLMNPMLYQIFSNLHHIHNLKLQQSLLANHLICFLTCKLCFLPLRYILYSHHCLCNNLQKLLYIHSIARYEQLSAIISCFSIEKTDEISSILFDVFSSVLLYT